MEQKRFLKAGLSTSNIQAYVGMVEDEVEEYLSGDPKIQTHRGCSATLLLALGTNVESTCRELERRLGLIRRCPHHARDNDPNGGTYTARSRGPRVDGQRLRSDVP